MPDFLAGQTLTALHFPPTVQDIEAGSYTFTNTTFGVGTTGGTYADCGVAFVAPTSGRVMVFWNAQISNSGAAGTTVVSFVIRTGGTVGSGTSVTAASDDDVVLCVGTDFQRSNASRMVPSLTPGDTYNVRLEHRVSSGTGTALRRSVVIVPAT